MRYKEIIRVLAVITVLCSLTYMLTRSVLVWFAHIPMGERVLAAILLLAEFFIVIHGMGYALNVLFVYGKHKQRQRRSDGLMNDMPSVAILVPARHEPREILENTFISIANMTYKNKHIYFLDDNTDERYQKEAREIAQDLGIHLFQRTKPWHGAKAGIVNDCIEHLSEKYVVVFDADQNPMPGFLDEVIPLLEANERLAFIQTPQFYSNITENPVARGAAFQQAVFYEYICEGKSNSDSMFCCGTNVILRTHALQSVGGFDESSITEDFATSLKLHQARWKSLYYPHVCAFGKGPEDLGAYFKQQFRWAAGTIGVAKTMVWQLISRPFSLRIWQWVEYLLSSTYYFVGMCVGVLIACPVLFILCDTPTFFAKPEVYIITFIPYILLSMSIFYFVLRQRNYSIRDLFLGQMLGFITFPVYIQAVCAVFSGKRISFTVTPKEKGVVAWKDLWLQISIILILFVTIVWGINRLIYERSPALVMNIFWTLYHWIMMCTIFYFNKEEA